MEVKVPISIPEDQLVTAMERILDKKGLLIVSKEDKHWRWLNASNAAKYQMCPLQPLVDWLETE